MVVSTPLEKYESQWEGFIPCIIENKQWLKPPTKYIYIYTYVVRCIYIIYVYIQTHSISLELSIDLDVSECNWIMTYDKVPN